MGTCCCKQRSDPMDALRQSPLGQCSNETLKSLVKYIGYETFAKGTELYSSQSQSDEPRKIFFICEGSVEYKYQGDPWIIENGAALGFEFMKEAGKPIDMIVSARSKIGAYVITIEALRKALEQCDESDRAYFYGTFPLELKLKEIRLFESLSDDELKLLGAVSTYKPLAAKETLVEEGEADSCMHVVLEGSMNLEATRTTLHRIESSRGSKAAVNFGKGETASPSSTLHRMTVHGNDASEISNMSLSGEGGATDSSDFMGRAQSPGDKDSEVVMDDKMMSPRARRLNISSIKKGESTGAAYFMTQMPHLTSLRADTNSLVLSIMKDHFEPFLQTHPEAKAVLEEDCGEQITRALTKFDVPFFRVLSPKVLHNFAKTATILQYDPNEVIMSQGEMGTTFYILISGRVGCFVSKNPLQEDLGEMSVRTSGKLFLQPTQTDLAMSPKLDSIKSPSKISRQSTGNLEIVDRSREKGLVSKVSSNSRRSISMAVVVQNLDGEKESQGNKDLIQVQDLEAGSYFGEIGLLQEVPRSATIIALEHCVVLEFTKKNFEDCLETAPGVRTDFKIKLAEYHCTLDDFLEHDMGQRFFHQFLQNEYSSENLEFWLAVEAFREKYEQQKENEDSDAPSKNPEDVHGYAERIAKKYVEPEIVNLGKKNKRAILKDLTAKKLTPESFEGAQKEIKKLMEQDSFQRFKKSTEFRDFLYETNSYVNVSNLQMEE